MSITTPKTTSDAETTVSPVVENSMTATRVAIRTKELELQAVTARSWTASLRQAAEYSTLISLVRFIFKNVASWIKTLILAPATIFLDPLSTGMALVVWPFVFFGLFIETLVLRVVMSIGGRWAIHQISETWCERYSVVNWPNPEIFTSQETKQAILSAKATLCGVATTIPNVPAPGTTNVDMDPELATTRIFDLDVARTLLVMSSLVYERDDDSVRKAADEAAQGRPVEAQKLVWQSESKIRNIAEAWGLNYEGITDLSLPGGSFASVFWTKSFDRLPFIILVFKGTSPFSFAEWLVDMTLSRINSAPYFGAGATHEGFTSRLFPTNQGGSDSYGVILRSLKHIASEIQKQLGRREPVPLWVTGHSLGSAMASLFFCRLLKSPKDLGDHLVLRDSYVYGTPRLGDGSFASSIDEAFVTPRDRANILWRVINAADIVCRVPPGLADKDSNRSTISASSLVNYAHVGVPFLLNPWFQPHFNVQEAVFRSHTRVVIVKDAEDGHAETGQLKSITSNRNIVSWLCAALTPAFIYDHAPASYYQHLKMVHATGQGGESRRSARLGAHPKSQPV
ncbi:hypothetical protein OIV83_001991 [Microbotryomycetes sp. JL201]|nr:hypothetical protein OIV83_001991 [Microbotryomycetes sp. JL201]